MGDYRKEVEKRINEIHKKSEIREYLRDYIPLKLYKYNRFDGKGYWKDLINGNLFMGRADQQNDPFEGLVTCNFLEVFKSEGFIENYEEFWFRKDHKLLNEEDGRQLIKSLQKTMSLTSFSEIDNSILMWSHYTYNHEGFCLEFHTENFTRFIKSSLYPTIYSNTKPDCTEGFIKQHGVVDLLGVLYKAEEWSYENEWRIVFLNTDPFKEPKKYLNMKKHIKSITLGVNCKQKNKDYIKHICVNNNWKLYQMKISDYEYKLIKHPITLD